MTGLVQIDDKGDREMDFALWDMTDTNSSIFEVQGLVIPPTHTHPRSLVILSNTFTQVAAIAQKHSENEFSGENCYYLNTR